MSTRRSVLVDINPRIIKAWRATFEENPEVEIVQGLDAPDQPRRRSRVTPTNSRASMDGGLDAAIKGHFGAGIENGVQADVKRLLHRRPHAGGLRDVRPHGPRRSRGS